MAPSLLGLSGSSCRPAMLLQVLLLLLASRPGALVSCAGIFEPGDPAKFEYYHMLTPASGPCDVTEGPDGLVYIQELFANKIARVNQTSGEVVEFDIPFTLPATSGPPLPLPGGLDKAVLAACGLRTGFDGNLYLSNGLHNQLVRHNVTSGATDVFTPPGGAASALGNLQPLNDVTTAPDGVYFTMTTANAIAKFDYATHAFTSYEIPTPLSALGGAFYTATDPPGVYVTEFLADKIGRLDTATGKITEFDVPGCGPFAIRAETTDPASGDTTVWFACAVASALGGLNTRTGNFTAIPTLTPEALPLEVAQDDENRIWVTYAATQRLGVYNTASGEYSEVGIPGGVVEGTPAASLPPYLGNGIFGRPAQSPTFGHGGIGNAMYFSETAQNVVARFDLTGFTVP